MTELMLALLVSLVDSVHPGIALMPSTLGLSTIKLESPAYYCTSYTPPCSEPGSLISSQYPTLSLPRSQSPNSGLSSDTSVIRVKRMRRMSSEGEETELRSGEGGKVGGDLYYSQSPLGQATSSWSQADLDQAASIGRFWLSFTFIELLKSLMLNFFLVSIFDCFSSSSWSSLSSLSSLSFF